jgi:hypothetical protein
MAIAAALDQARKDNAINLPAGLLAPLPVFLRRNGREPALHSATDAEPWD